MAESRFFEEMLATYPAEKRELARAVYHRFADGDSTQFFTQLFLVLDVYAHYVERIPSPDDFGQCRFAGDRCRRCARKSVCSPRRLKPAMSTSPITPKKRTSFAESRWPNAMRPLPAVELMVKNLGAQVDTKAIVQGIQNALNPASPGSHFTVHPAHGGSGAKVMPTLEKIRECGRRSQIGMVKADLENRLDHQFVMEHWGGSHLHLPDLPEIRRTTTNIKWRPKPPTWRR